MIGYDAPNPRQEEQVDVTAITIGLFFDGTANNSNNVKAREAWENDYKTWTEKEKEIEEERKKNLIRNLELKLASDHSFSTSKSQLSPAEKYIQNYKPSEEVEAYMKYKDSSGGDNSYTGDHTNVYRLFDAYKKNDSTIRRFYIEGIGTTDYQRDDRMDGTAFGHGINGIRGKVYKACTKVVEACPETIRYITIDVFGFSRGAAAARNFVYEIMRPDSLLLNDQFEPSDMDIDSLLYIADSFEFLFDDSPKNGMLGWLFKKKGIEIDDIHITIRFAGIFDTVASYSLPMFSLANAIKIKNKLSSKVKKLPDGGIELDKASFPDFEGGARELSLNEIQNHATQIIHLVAENEIRKNFAITPIMNNGDRAKELILPGVHSDVGGGYLDGVSESKQVATEYSNKKKLEEREDELLKQGFFYKHDLRIDERNFGVKSPTNAFRSHLLVSNKESINAKYNRIPLKIVADFGEQLMIKKNRDEMFEKNIIDKHTYIPENDLPTLRILKSTLATQLEGFITFWQFENKSLNAYEKYFKSAELLEDLFEKWLDLRYGVSPNIYKIPDEEILYYTKVKIMNWIFGKEDGGGKGEPFVYKTAKQIVSNDTFITSFDYILNNMSKVLNLVIEQIVLRQLRRNCMHWSANCKGFLVKAHNPSSLDESSFELTDDPSTETNSSNDAKYGIRPVHRG